MLTTPKTTDPPLSPAPLDGIGHSLGGEERLINGVFEPPSGFLLTALSRNKLLIGALTLLLAVGGVLYGRSRPKTYTASATLQVGQVNPNSPGFFGYEQSAASLASSFSRSVNASAVLEVIQHKLKLAPSIAVTRLSSEPLPATPAFRVIGTGPSAAAAMDLTNVASGAVIQYEDQSNNSNPEAKSLLHEYRDATVDLQRDVAKVSELVHSKNTPSTSALAEAQAEKSAAQVRLRAISQAYVGAVTSQAPRDGLVSLIAGATSASGDRSSKVETYGLIGLLAGIVVGCVAAVVRERLRVGRRRAAMGRFEVSGSEPA